MEDIADKIERSLLRYLDSIYEMRCRITDDRLKPGPYPGIYTSMEINIEPLWQLFAAGFDTFPR